MREAQDAVLGADLPATETEVAIELFGRLRDLAASHIVAEPLQPAANRPDLPVRGNPMMPLFVVESSSPEGEVSSGRFPRAFQGYGAAHGGSVALLFDEMLGRVAEQVDSVVRTAQLAIHFRNLTPLDTPLRLETGLVRRDGRKFYLAGRLLDGDCVLAEADGLWVRPRDT